MEDGSFGLRVVSMRCLVAEPGASFEWHSHPFEEFTLVADDKATIGYPPGKRTMQENTLLMYHRGERHGAWCLPGQAPRFWVVHFTANAQFYQQADRLRAASAKDRVWQLSPEQAASFKGIFLRMLTERMQRRNLSRLAESAWLQLLLISVERWVKGETVADLSPAGTNPEAMRLWHLVNASVGKPDELAKQIHQMPNYDSLRHAFRKTFGCSPRKMMLSLRLQQAKNMLLETSLSIKEISIRAGYQRQHEFARAFHQQVGVAPSEWRANPIQSSLTV